MKISYLLLTILIAQSFSQDSVCPSLISFYSSLVEDSEKTLLEQSQGSAVCVSTEYLTGLKEELERLNVKASYDLTTFYAPLKENMACFKNATQSLNSKEKESVEQMSEVSKYNFYNFAWPIDAFVRTVNFVLARKRNILLSKDPSSEVVKDSAGNIVSLKWDKKRERDPIVNEFVRLLNAKHMQYGAVSQEVLSQLSFFSSSESCSAVSEEETLSPNAEGLKEVGDSEESADMATTSSFAAEKTEINPCWYIWDNMFHIYADSNPAVLKTEPDSLPAYQKPSVEIKHGQCDALDIGLGYPLYDYIFQRSSYNYFHQTSQIVNNVPTPPGDRTALSNHSESLRVGKYASELVNRMFNLNELSQKSSLVSDFFESMRWVYDLEDEGVKKINSLLSSPPSENFFFYCIDKQCNCEGCVTAQSFQLKLKYEPTQNSRYSENTYIYYLKYEGNLYYMAERRTTYWSTFDLRFSYEGKLTSVIDIFEKLKPICLNLNSQGGSTCMNGKIKADCFSDISTSCGDLQTWLDQRRGQDQMARACNKPAFKTEEEFYVSCFNYIINVKGLIKGGIKLNLPQNIDQILYDGLRLRFLAEEEPIEYYTAASYDDQLSEIAFHANMRPIDVAGSQTDEKLYYPVDFFYEDSATETASFSTAKSGVQRTAKIEAYTAADYNASTSVAVSLLAFLLIGLLV